MSSLCHIAETARKHDRGFMTSTSTATPSRPARASFNYSRTNNARRLRMNDVAMDEREQDDQEEEESGRASPVLNKTLFSGGFSDSSSDDETTEVCMEQEESGYGRAGRSSYRSRSRRITGLRASAPEVAYTVVTPMKASRAAAKRRHSIESCRMVAEVASFDSPRKLPKSPMKRVKVPFPPLYSPVQTEKDKAPVLETPCKMATPPKSPDRKMSVCSTMSTWAPWDSPPAKIEDEEPIPQNVSFKSPVPPTPLKQRTPTPARQKFLSCQQVLIQVHYATDSVDACQTAFQDLEIVGWLGAGVSAEVLKAFSRKQNRYFAVKKTKHELRSERERDILLQEIVIAEQIAASGSSFSHIVKYHQAWQDEGYLFVQTELCTGGNLRDFKSFCKGRAIPEDCLWTILNHIGQGLDSLHANNVVHLDIKPENVFIASDGALKIGDLGMAAQNSSASKRVDDLEGDPAYMAKELLSSAQRCPSADIFCLGIMMLELATGIELPASGEDWHALRDAQLPVFPSEYSSELRSALAQMMHPNPKIRPTTAEIVGHPHIRKRSAPAASILEYAQHHQTAVVKVTPDTMLSETPRKPRLSLSLFSDD